MDMQSGTAEVRSHEVVIVGAGFAGIGMAVGLHRHGFDDYVVLERGEDIGGTWRDNRYPGAACDVPSHLYSFSFSPNPNWSRTFSPQQEIWEYQKKVVAEAGIRDKFLFGRELLAARWDSDEQEWELRTSNGAFRARYFIAATGTLSDPKLPAIPGIDDFSGKLMHSATWDAQVEFSGLRVGVIGTGASGVQIIPELAKTAGTLTVFQRSAPYVTPRHDREYSAAEKRLFERLPERLAEMRSEMFWQNEGRFVERQAIPALLEESAKLALDHLATQVTDPELRAKLTPDYQIGCKRILKSQDYYPALTQDNVTLETRVIDRMYGTTIRLADGDTVELDVLVLATGFEAADLQVAHRISGRGGVVLGDQWQGGMQAYATTTVHNFPNFFILKGPNAGLGHNSILYIIEAQIDYVIGALEFAKQNRVVEIEVLAAAEEAYVEGLTARSRGTVWLEGGCHSWYVDARNGRLTTVWPDFAHLFREENAEFVPGPYRTISPEPVTP